MLLTVTIKTLVMKSTSCTDLYIEYQDSYYIGVSALGLLTSFSSFNKCTYVPSSLGITLFDSI